MADFSFVIFSTISFVIFRHLQSVPHRVLAAKLGAYEFVVKALHSNEALNDEVRLKLIAAANAIINKQPDVFDIASLSVILELLKGATDQQTVCELLKWLQKACLLHEMNRQTIMQETLTVTTLKGLLTRIEPEIIRNACTLLRFLILDDDIRVEFGKAHEHARLLAGEMLTEITQLLTSMYSELAILPDLD